MFAQAGSETPLVEYLRALFAMRPADLIVPIGAPAMFFLHRHSLFPNVPVLAVAADKRRIGDLSRGNTTAFGISLDLGGIVEHILRILPKTTDIEVVTGNSPFEKFWQTEFRQDTQHLTDRVHLNFLNELSFEEINHRLSRLPPNSAIVYFLLVVDAAGVPYEQERALDVLRLDSNAPIFGIFDHQLGRAIVGGPLSPYQEVARRSAGIALQILNGMPPSSIKPVFLGPATPEYDWRELRRWDIDESRLPPGSVVQFRSPSVWEQYRWYIVGAFAIIAVQALLIVGLLLQRARRRRAEADLRESQELMELSTDAGELGLWSRSLERGELWANVRLRSLFGFGPNDVLRVEDMIGRIHPDDQPRVIVEVERAQRTGEPFEDEFRVINPDGSERWIATKGRTVAEAGGNGARRMGVMFDITQRKRAEEGFRESEARFRTMANTAPVMIWMSGPDKLCTFFNKGWLDFTGRPIEKELGNGWTEGVHREDLARCLEIYASSFNARQEFTMEYRLRRHDGKYCWIIDNGVPRFEPDGAFLGYIGSCLDIDERKQAEQDLTAALGEIQGLKEQLEEENIYLKEEISEVKGFDEIVGKSDALKYVLTRVEQVAKTDATVLLQGETGVGKELIARAIHERSSRSDGPLVKVNCATLPEALVESELFGHEKGAFTGADRQRKGRFELADGGTILLDEVGELPAGTQAKLLRVLQEGEFERVGGSSTIKVKVRVIAATNRKLNDEVSAGRFRQDLFYRLNVYPITTPPLRQRREDIPLLVSHYAREIGERLSKNIREIPGHTMKEFTEYNWPGNVRELQNVIERAVIVSSDGVLRLPEPLGQATPGPASESRTFSDSTTVSTMGEAEREHILRALEATGWRINGPRGAAAMLKLHPSTLRFRMKKLGLTKLSVYPPPPQKSNLH
jgi:PAS domain S-box-containing protein